MSGPDTALFVLDVDDFRPLARAAARLEDVTVIRQGPYYRVSSQRPFAIERAGTGCRNAVWYSSVAAVRYGRVAQWDRDVLRIVPALPERTTGPAGHAGG